jgi:acyl carrier protein
MIKAKIKEYIVENFMNGEGRIKDDDQLFETGIIDSIGFIKLLSFIETTFNTPLDISDFTIESGSINGIMVLIENKMK